MPPEIDPAHMTADQRLREVAALLAAAVLRLRQRAALPDGHGQQPAPGKPPETGQD